MFTQADANHDGKLQCEEFMPSMLRVLAEAKSKAKSTAKPKNTVKRADKASAAAAATDKPRSAGVGQREGTQRNSAQSDKIAASEAALKAGAKLHGIGQHKTDTPSSWRGSQREESNRERKQKECDVKSSNGAGNTANTAISRDGTSYAQSFLQHAQLAASLVSLCELRWQLRMCVHVWSRSVVEAAKNHQYQHFVALVTTYMCNNELLSQPDAPRK